MSLMWKCLIATNAITNYMYRKTTPTTKDGKSKLLMDERGEVIDKGK